MKNLKSLFNLKKCTFTLLSLLMTSTAYSQTPSLITINGPDTSKVCYQNHFTASFTSAGTPFAVQVNSYVLINASGDTVDAVCPPGGGSVNAVKMQIDSFANCTVNQIGADKWSITASGAAMIYYSLFPDCSILSDTALINSNFAETFISSTSLLQTWTDTLTNVPIPLINNDILLTYPVITKIATPPEYGNYKGTHDSLFVYFVYRNSGSCEANIIFNFRDSLNCGSYSLIGNPGYCISSYDTGKGNLFYTPFTAGSDTAAFIPPNYYLIVQEHILIDSCMPCANEKVLFSFRCNTTPSACTACQDNYVTTYNIYDQGTRNATYSRIIPANSDTDITCNGSPYPWQFKILNSGQFGLKRTDVTLDYHLQGGQNNVLSLIDTSSLQISKSILSIFVTDTIGDTLNIPSGCIACFDTFPAYILPECASQMPYRFKRFKFSVHDLRPGQYVLLDLATTRCATSDSLLMDVPKFFNEWTLHITHIDECGDTIPAQNINPGGIFQNNITKGFSEESNGSEGIDQQLDLSTTVTNLSIPPGPGTGVRYGDEAQIAVDLQGVTTDPYEYDHFGCTALSQPYTCQLKGFIKARVLCSSGLLVADTNVFLNYNLDTLRPVLAYADTSSPFACDSGSYTYIFDLSMNPNAYALLNFGQFIFTLGSCCPNADPHGHYRIAFYLLADPMGNCYSSILGTPYTYSKLDTAALQWLCLSSIQSVCEISCPGCKSVGAAAYGYSIDRITYGLADSDNDRIADTTLTPIDSSYAWFSKLNLKASMHGDRLFEKLAFALQDGDSTGASPGYAYSQMLAHNARLRYLQVQRTFPLMDDTMDIHIERVLLYIDKQDTANADSCYDCADYGNPPYNFSTMCVLTLNASQLGGFVDTPAFNNRLYTFRDSLLEYPSVLPEVIYESSYSAFQFHRFDTDQRYRLSVVYNVCGNFEAPQDGYPIKKESNIINRVWLSGAAQANANTPTMPDDQADLHTYGWTLDTVAFPNDTLINQQFADTYRFWCTTRNGRHFFYSNEQSLRTDITLSPDSCDRYISIVAQSTIARKNTEVFPFEFRRPVMAPVTYDAKLPAHYYFKNPVLLRTYSYYVNHFSYTLDPEVITTSAGITLPAQTDTFHITLAQLPQIVCFKDTADNVVSAGDQQLWMEIIVHAGDSVCEADTNIMRTKVLFTDNDALACENSNNPYCGTDSVLKLYNTPTPDIIPNLQITHTNQVSAMQPTVCWEVEIENTGGTQAYNVFIADSGYSFLSGWTWGGTPLPANSPYIVAPVLNPPAPMPPPHLITDSLCATFMHCPDDSIVPLIFHWGWNCDTVFANVESSCGYFTDTLLVELYRADWLEQHYMDSVTLCQPFEITAWFTSIRPGSIFPLSALMDTLQSGLTVISCTAAQAGTVDTLTTVDSLTWNFPAGYEVQGFDSVKVMLTLLPGCGFFATGDTLPSLTLYSIKYCGDTITNTVNFGQPVQSIDTPSVCVSCSCFDLTAVHIADSVFSSSLGSGLSNTSVLIEGRFYINNSFLINNCTVYASAGAQIIILSGTLTIDSATHISACDTMWRGIHMEEETYFYEKNESSVADADTGLFVSNSCYFEITNSEITECVTGVYIPPSPVAVHGIYGKIAGSRFGMTQAFKPDYNGQTYHGILPKAGIEMYNMIFSLGDTSSALNEFFNMNTGIVAHNSNLTVKRSRFHQIALDTAYSEIYMGTAIVSDRVFNSSFATTKLSVMPEILSYNTVDSSYRGIYTYGSGLNVNYVHLLNVRQGVHCENAPLLSTNMVTNCTITASNNGLYFIYNPLAWSVIANSNKITINGASGLVKPARSAITMLETNYGLVRYTAENDSIFLTNASFGIYGGYLLLAKIKFNYIKINGDGLGIAIGSNYQTSVSCNTVKGDYSGSTQNSIGVYTANSSYNTAMYCNSVDSTYRGFYFGGWCPGTMFKGNNMFKHFVGLYLNTGSSGFPTVIGIQPHHGNKWNDTTVTLGAINLTQPPLWVPSSRFDVDSTLGPIFNPLVNPGSWFKSDTSSNTFFCSNSLACSIPPPALSNDELSELIANGAFDSEDFADEARAIAEEYLYRELADDSAMWVDDSTYVEFMLAKQGENTGYLYDAERYLTAAYQFDSLFILLMDSTKQLINQFTDSISGLNEQAGKEPYDSLREQCIDKLKFLNQTLENLSLMNEAVIADNLENAELRNDYVIAGELPEINVKYINDIEILFAGEQNKTIIYNNYTGIYAVASQCPFAGGAAVERARTFVAMINDSIAYDDYNICLQSGIFRATQAKPEEVKIEDKILIKPNPANNKIEILLKGEFEEGICTVEIANSLGKTVLSVEMSCKEKMRTIDISKLSQGVYTVEVNANDSVRLNSKLVIVR